MKTRRLLLPWLRNSNGASQILGVEHTPCSMIYGRTPITSQQLQHVVAVDLGQYDHRGVCIMTSQAL